MLERGEDWRGGVEAWLWPSSKYRLSCWQGIQSFMTDVTPECKLLTAYAGHFDKATCVTRCILGSGSKDQLTTQSIKSNPSVLLRTILLFTRTCSYLFQANRRRARSLRQDATIVVFPTCSAGPVVHYTIVRYLTMFRILDRTTTFLDTIDSESHHSDSESHNKRNNGNHTLFNQQGSAVDILLIYTNGTYVVAHHNISTP